MREAEKDRERQIKHVVVAAVEKYIKIKWLYKLKLINNNIAPESGLLKLFCNKDTHGEIQTYKGLGCEAML